MKRLLVLLILLGISHISPAQNFSLPLKDASKEELNTAAKNAADYILATPTDTTNAMRRNAEQFLFVWMEKTDQYSFSVDYTIAKMIEENKSVGYLIFAAMANCMFKDKSQSDDQIKLSAFTKLAEYSRNVNNNVHPGPELKKMIKAEQKGKLSEYLSNSNAK